jgi:hypothetical protein
MSERSDCVSASAPEGDGAGKAAGAGRRAPEDEAAEVARERARFVGTVEVAGREAMEAKAVLDALMLKMVDVAGKCDDPDKLARVCRETRMLMDDRVRLARVVYPSFRSFTWAE